ncbi:hypothetical protein [Sulfuricurvum sp.]|uniref:hypothetical protein n=1 Tax=Sulfuricurvum sp. TaxID=2025608 RepID=UPI003565FA8C
MNREELEQKYKELPPDDQFNKPKNAFPDGKHIVQVTGVREGGDEAEGTITYSLGLNVYQGPFIGSRGEEFYYIKEGGNNDFTFQKLRWFLTAAGLENEGPFCLSDPDTVEAITGLLFEATLTTNKKQKRDKNGNLYKSWGYWKKCDAQPAYMDDTDGITNADVDNAENNLGEPPF